eukprot:GHVU01042329.1.p2 GENE.GHVU01042329.1~~GHVU01042329.1.p2  ORF type:complete len:209 (+),score=51.93 GHVU01042329.1:93-629(+)
MGEEDPGCRYDVKREFESEWKRAFPDGERLQLGSQVRGEVAAVDDEGVWLQTPLPERLLIPPDQLYLDRSSVPTGEMRASFAIGRKLTAAVWQLAPAQQVLLTRRHLQLAAAWASLLKRHSRGIAVRASITGVGGRGVRVLTEAGVPGFVPDRHLLAREGGRRRRREGRGGGREGGGG